MIIPQRLILHVPEKYATRLLAYIVSAFSDDTRHDFAHFNTQTQYIWHTSKPSHTTDMLLIQKKRIDTTSPHSKCMRFCQMEWQLFFHPWFVFLSFFPRLGSFRPTVRAQDTGTIYRNETSKEQSFWQVSRTMGEIWPMQEMNERWSVTLSRTYRGHH